MKFLCPNCRELSDIAAVRAEGGQVRFTCAHCGAEAAADAPSAPPAPLPLAENVVPFRRGPPDVEMPNDPFFTPPGRCPKCIAERLPEASTCNWCGLVFALFRAEHLEPGPLVSDAWRSLWHAWEDESAHERFRTVALQENELIAAARLYQLRVARSLGDPFAERGRAEVVRLASQAVAVERPSQTNRLRAWRLWAVAAGMLVGSLFFLWTLTSPS